MNVSEGDGGGISVIGAMTLTIYSSSFVGNEAQGIGGCGFGGGIYVESTLTYIEDTDFIGNDSASNGGGIYVYNSTLTMTYGMLLGNTSGGNGGGIYVDADTYTITLDEVSVTDNHAAQNGGGAYILWGTLDGQLTASPDDFRKKLRRAMVRQGDCLLTVLRDGKTIDLPVFFPMAK